MIATVIQGSFVGGGPRLPGSVAQAKTMPRPPGLVVAQSKSVPLPPGPPAPAFAARLPVAQRHGGVGAFAVEAGQLGLSSGGGRPLPDAVRGKMEAALGADFANVRVYVGPQAERIGAIAFTVGSDIYFAPGRFRPDTVHGQQLLGHELAHVVQQRQGRVRNPLGSGLGVVQDHALEAEADRLGRHAASAAPARRRQIQPMRRGPAGAAGPTANATLQRRPQDWAGNASVTSILSRSGSATYWQPIKTSIRAYQGLAEGAVNSRSAELDRLGREIDAWEQNQRTANVVRKGTRDAKRRELGQLRTLIGQERQEILAAQAPPAPTPARAPRPATPPWTRPITTTASVPITRPTAARMPITNQGRGAAAAVAPVATSLGPLPQQLPPPTGLHGPAISAQKQAVFSRLFVYVHWTKEEFRGGIHVSGLRPGARQGIGLPDDGEPDFANVYVVSGSAPEAVQFVSGEAGGAPVVVISHRLAPDRDPNYRGGAYRFGRAIPTGRNYGGTAGHSEISLPLPLTQSGKTGLANFINEGAGLPVPITPDEAEILLAQKLYQKWPLHFRGYRPRGNSESSESDED